jgi:ankyrin repeat protein
VEILVAKGADVSYTPEKDYPPLHYAVWMEDTDIARVLLDHGANSDVKDQDGRTAFRHAIDAANRQMVDLFVAKGANVNAKGQDNSTPLHQAAMSGRRDIVEILLANGADVTIKDGRGRTPVNLASERGHAAIEQILTDAALTGRTEDEAGRTILHKASSEGWVDTLQRILKGKPDLNVQDKQGLTPLHLAVGRVHKDIVEHLIVNGAKLNVKDSAGRTALHYAAGASVWTDRNLEQSTDIVRFLLDNGADIHAQDNVAWTPLHYAARFRHESAVRLLLEKGTDPSIADNRGQTPLSLIQRLLSQIRAHGAEKQRTIEFNRIIDSLRPYTRVYYVSPGGKDSNPGTMEYPLKSIHAAVEVAGPGDNIIVRSGTYAVGSTIDLAKSGTVDKPITLRAHPSDSPMLDFSGAKGIGIRIVGAYWHIKGLTIVNAETNGIRMEGGGAHHNIVEQTTTYANQLGGTGLIDGAAFNLFLNCDSYKNFDAETNGENADGIYVARSVGQGNVVIGCRSWNNADDGYDMWEASNRVRLERCYAWRNGDNIWNHPFYTGNGNGFKLGQLQGDHLLIHCVAWDHPWRGFDLNGNSTGVTLHNCTAFRNNINYAFTYSKGNIEKNVLRSNLSYKGLMQIRPEVDDQFNSWNMPLDTEITEQDFVSLDDSIFTGPRNPDGSIPESGFLRLAPGSAAIDKGIDVNMPYAGKAPDPGAFEYNPNDNSGSYVKRLHQTVRDHDVKQIEQLLTQGEGINDKDWLGYTPLHWAVYFGYPDLIELLISKGAGPNIQSDTGRYALEIAQVMAYPELEALLRTLGAKAGDVKTK